MNYVDTPAEPDSVISPEECVAMRALDSDDSYSRSQIAFLFECKQPTVSQHCDNECSHTALEADRITASKRYYRREQLVEAFRLVAERVDGRMSKSDYQRERPAEFPSRNTIAARLGGWNAARRLAINDTGGDKSDGGQA